MDLTADQLNELQTVCRQFFDRAYARYSNFPVGAALLTESGEIIGGCNVENCVFPLGNCAEVVAVNTAVSRGHLKFKAVGIITKANEWTMPCGKCRQVLAEFSPEIEVVLFKLNGEICKRNLRELLPEAFTPATLRNTTGSTSGQH